MLSLNYRVYDGFAFAEDKNVFDDFLYYVFDVYNPSQTNYDQRKKKADENIKLVHTELGVKNIKEFLLLDPKHMKYKLLKAQNGLQTELMFFDLQQAHEWLGKAWESKSFFFWIEKLYQKSLKSFDIEMQLAIANSHIASLKEDNDKLRDSLPQYARPAENAYVLKL